VVKWHVRGTVTISSSFGAGGANIGPAVAAELGLKFYDRAIPVAVASELQIDQDEAIALDSKAPGRLERLLTALSTASLPIGVPEMPGDLMTSPNRFKDATERVLHQIADSDGGVILGRAAMVVLAHRPDVLSVRLTGPAEARIARAIASGQDEATARAEQKSTDAARDAYAQAFYGVKQRDSALYHLLIDTTAFSDDACVKIVVQAARDRLGS
jgi:cytidylate kinase